MGRDRKGSIIKKNGKLFARIQFIDDCGKRRDICRKADNQKHARKIIDDLLKEIENKTAKELDAASITFADLTEHYIENYLHAAVYVNETKVSGVRDRKNALYELKPIIEFFGNRKLNAITFGDIRRYKQHRLNTPTQNGNQRGIAMLNKELGKLRRMLNIAVREQWLPRNPFSNGESLISTEVPRTRILSIAEEKRLFEAIEAEPKRVHVKGMTLMALDCALRRGEIFTLDWSCVDLENRTLTITAFNSKTARSRTVAMTTRVYEFLKKHWQDSGRDKNDLVFGVSVTIKTAWKKICRLAKIENFHFHDCRATAISRMIQAGIPPAEVMRVSGHTTLRAFSIYVRTDLDSAYRAANALDNLYIQSETFVGLSNS